MGFQKVFSMCPALSNEPIGSFDQAHQLMILSAMRDEYIGVKRAASFDGKNYVGVAGKYGSLFVDESGSMYITDNWATGKFVSNNDVLDIVSRLITQGFPVTGIVELMDKSTLSEVEDEIATMQFKKIRPTLLDGLRVCERLAS